MGIRSIALEMFIIHVFNSVQPFSVVNDVSDSRARPLNGRVLNVSKFLSQHPGDELAILTFAGKDATADFDMIHPPDMVEKYAPDAIVGVVGNGEANKAKGVAKSALHVATDKGDLEAWGDWRMKVFDDTPRVLLVNVRSYGNACYYDSQHRL